MKFDDSKTLIRYQPLHSLNRSPPYKSPTFKRKSPPLPHERHPLKPRPKKSSVFIDPYQ